MKPLICPRCIGEMILRTVWGVARGRRVPPGWYCEDCGLLVRLTQVFDATDEEIGKALRD